MLCKLITCCYAGFYTSDIHIFTSVIDRIPLNSKRVQHTHIFCT